MAAGERTARFPAMTRRPATPRLFRGEGRQARHIRIEDARAILDPGINALLAAAAAGARTLLPSSVRGHAGIESVSAVQGRRRPGGRS